MTKKADPDELLAQRCVAILQQDNRPRCSVTLGRLLNEHSSDIFRVLSKHPRVSKQKGLGLTMFSVTP